MRRSPKTPLALLGRRFTTTAAGCLVCGCAVGLTALSALAQPPASEASPAAKANTQAQASTKALAILAAARTFKPAPMPAIPSSTEQWKKLGLSLDRAKLKDGRYVVKLHNGATATLSLDPKLQGHLEKMFARYKMPHGSVVLLEPDTGRVLAMVSHNSDKKHPVQSLARKPRAPSASVFKVITSAALLELDKIKPGQRVCYHGGRSKLTAKNIKGDQRLDKRCNDLSAAVAWSINSIIAKLAYKHLDKKTFKRFAERFGYNKPIPFELPIENSRVEIVDDPLERARSAAGFWHSYLSPLHGALIGATIINDGVMMRPTIIDRYQDPRRKIDHHNKPRKLRRVVSRSTARTLRKMMERTTRVDTARKYFRFRKGFPKSIKAGGKTGTLSEHKPRYLGFTWFVGFAQDDKIKGAKPIAVSALACNTPVWHIKGAWAASEAVRKHFQLQRHRAEARSQVERSKAKHKLASKPQAGARPSSSAASRSTKDSRIASN